MKRISLMLIICFLGLNVVAGEKVYKKINPDGSVEFTDVPTGESEEIEIKEPTTYPSKRYTLPEPPSKQGQESKQIYSVTIKQPANDSTIFEDVSVEVVVEPALNLALNHRLHYQVAGQTRISQSLTESFAEIYRGTHQVQVHVVGPAGEIISPQATSTIHVKRFFKKPTPPPAPPPPPPPGDDS